MIPKIVHYIWVGGHPLPDRNSRLLEGNRRHLDGYDIRIWNEQNLDLSAPFVARAYKEKRWAFVSDYVRFVLLRDIGGVYLDTDMELLRPLADLHGVNGFAGWNRAGDYIYCGAVGASPGHPLMHQLVRDYDALPPGQWPTSPQMLTAAWQRSPNDFTVHPFQVFYPVEEGGKADPALLAQAYATHYWDESWRRWVRLRRVLRRTGVIPLYHHVRGRLAAKAGNL